MSAPQPAAGETHVSWQDYVAIVVRRRWYFMIPCATIVGLTMLVGLVMPRIYQAEATVLIENAEIMKPLMSGMAVATDVEQRLRVVRDQLLGWTSMDRLVGKLGLDQGVKTKAEREKLIDGLREDIIVSITGRGSLVKISYEGRDPQLVQRVVNTVTDVYLERNVESQNTEAETAITFIEGEMDGYKKKLEEAEQALREFKEVHAMEMPVATQLNDQVVRLEVELAQLSVDNTEEHPRVIETHRQIEELKRRRNEEIRRVIVRALAKGGTPDIYGDLAVWVQDPEAGVAKLDDPMIQAAHTAYAAWVERLENTSTQSAANAQVAVSSVGPDGQSAEQAFGTMRGQAPTSITLGPAQEQEMSRLSRDYDVHRKTYERMQERLEQAKITQRLSASNEGTKFKVIEPARVPARPAKPNLLLFFLVSFVVGFVIGSGAAFIAEFLDESFQTAEDAQAALELPVLGAISKIVTAEDVEMRRRQMKKWFSFRRPGQRLKALLMRQEWLRALQPTRARMDRFLLRLGL